MVSRKNQEFYRPRCPWKRLFLWRGKYSNLNALRKISQTSLDQNLGITCKLQFRGFHSSRKYLLTNLYLNLVVWFWLSPCQQIQEACYRWSIQIRTQNQYSLETCRLNLKTGQSEYWSDFHRCRNLKRLCLWCRILYRIRPLSWL